MKIVTVGWIRSGTSWILALLTHYFEGPSVPAWTFLSRGVLKDFMHQHEMTLKMHDDWLQEGFRFVYAIRDPRDVAISSYFFHYNNTHLPKAQYTLLEYLQDYFSVHRFTEEYAAGWRAHMEKWLAMPDTVYAQHEKLYYNREQELRRIVSELGVTPEQDRLDFAIRESFTATAWRPAYKDPNNYRNKARIAPSGKPGEWKNHFGKAEIAFMKDYCGDLMEELGYEW